MKKTFLPFAAARLCGLSLLVTSSWAADSKDTKVPAHDTPLARPPVVTTDTPTPPTKLPESVKEEKAREKAVENHIMAPDMATMASPPPPLKTETSSPSPGPDYKWRAGYWKPVNGQWSWVAGQWEMPPTASSVWLEGRYDEKTKKWSAPYWQADRPTPYDSENPPKEVVEPKKF